MKLVRAVLSMAAVTTVAFGLGTTPDASATVLPGASVLHPYSNPGWSPLSTPAVMGCDNGNPGCTDPVYHGYWAIDLISRNPNYPSATDPLEPVYAMGAGIVHIGATNQGCGGTPSRGNWIYIDHGNGTLSYYGHLGTIAVHSGDYVTARTRIATIGNSGYAGCKKYPYYRYLFLAVKRGGTNGAYASITHTYTCVNGAEQKWPDALNAAWTQWNLVPANTRLEPTDGNRLCIPVPPPTPNKPTGNTLRPYGAGRLHATWNLAPAASHPALTLVQFQEYHPSLHEWLDYENRLLRPALTATTYSGLPVGRVFRARISFANGTGWSAPTAYVVATVGS